MSNTHNVYAEKINRVCDYIYRNLDSDLSLDKLSDIAHFSKYHFHRQFTNYLGITAGKYIQLMRLKRASYQLVFHPNEQIISIAMDASFENPESFSRAFKKAFGQTPSQFRKAPDWQSWHQHYQHPNRGIIMKIDIEITRIDPTKTAVLEHRGPAELLNNSVSQFIKWRKTTGLSPVECSKSFGIAYDDPSTTDPAKFRFDICGEVQENVAPNDYGITNKTIPGGRCAKVRHVGPYEDMDEKIRYLYSTWLPESGELLRDFPVFFQYINLFPEVPEHELITDIYLLLD